MIVLLFLVCFVSQTAFGAEINDKENEETMQTILKELDTMKNQLKEMNYLKERTLLLENEVESLKRQNDNLNQKVDQLESRCEEHTEKVKDVEGKQQPDISVRPKHIISAVKSAPKFSMQNSNLKRLETLEPRQVSPQPHVAFTAGVSSENLHNLGVHQTIIFDKVITNIGNAYHQYTGIIAVPVKGAYAITLTITVEPNKVQWVDLVVDAAQINFISAGPGNDIHYASATKQWIIELDAGSEVWFRKSAKGMADSHDLHGNMNTTVSGHLLFQT